MKCSQAFPFEEFVGNMSAALLNYVNFGSYDGCGIDLCHVTGMQLDWIENGKIFQLHSTSIIIAQFGLVVEEKYIDIC